MRFVRSRSHTRRYVWDWRLGMVVIGVLDLPRVYRTEGCRTTTTMWRVFRISEFFDAYCVVGEMSTDIRAI